MKLTKKLVSTSTFLALGLLGVQPGAAASATTTENLPNPGDLNVIVIVLDDLGNDQLRMYGQDPGPAFPCAQTQVNTTPTPWLNILRATGVLFTRAYANPLCSPTRASILTGRAGFRVGIGSAIERGNSFTLQSSELFLSELIRDYNPQQYARGAFGKWHVADINTQDAHAADNGFENYQGTKGNLDDFYAWRKVTATGGTGTGLSTSSSEQITPGTAPPSEATYVSSVTRRDAATWINQQTKPFFAYVGFNPPHAPFQTPPNKLLSKKTRAKLAALGYEPGEKAGPLRSDQILLYQAAIEAVDREIYELMVAIIYKLPRTMVVIMGDNGTPAEVVQDPTLSNRVKRSVQELGCRVPMLVTGPLAWCSAGQTSRNLVSCTDLWRTVANFTGIPNATVDQAIAATTLVNDSISFYDQVLDPGCPGDRTYAYSELFQNRPPPIPPTVTWLRSMTDGHYRYVRLRLSGVITEELYDLFTDPCGSINLMLPPHVLTTQEQAAKAAMSAAMDAL